MSATGSAVSDGPSIDVEPRYPLYRYQQQVLRDILNALGEPSRRTVAHLPTGAGKTRIATHAVCHLLNTCALPRALIVWLAATEELCEQAASEIERAWQYLGQRTAGVHRHWALHSPDVRRLGTGFLVTSLPKLYAADARDTTLLSHLAQRTGGVVFDEAHQAIANTYRYMTEQLCSCRPPLLGLTATPGRTANVSEVDRNLAAMFDYRKVTIDPRGHDSAVTYLIQNNYLARPTFIPISIDAAVDVPTPRVGMDYRQQDLERLGDSSTRTTTIIDVAIRAIRRHPRTIVFCPSVASAVACSQVLKDRGIWTRVVTAQTPGEARQEFIADFRSASAERMILFNYGVLTAGFDAPRTRCVVVARPTTSLVLYSQMIGRALRGPRSGGNRSAEIYTVADRNLRGFDSVVAAFNNWEDLWRCR